MSEPIHQEIGFAAAPARLYEALMDSGEHAAFTANGAAEISREAGGALRQLGGKAHFEDGRQAGAFAGKAHPVGRGGRAPKGRPEFGERRLRFRRHGD